MDSRWACGFVIFACAAVVGPLSIQAQAPDKNAEGSSSSRETHPSSKVPKQSTSAAAPDLGSVRDQTYRNVTFGISYKVPYGWVLRTEQMRETPSASSQEAPSPKSYVLLAAFERPPEAVGDSVNSAVVITAENLSEYPGLDRAIDYFDVLDEITREKDFKVLNEPYEFPVGTKKLARGDYIKHVSDGVAMYQASLVWLDKGYVLSFTFIADSEDELESLIMDLRLVGTGSGSRR